MTFINQLEKNLTNTQNKELIKLRKLLAEQHYLMDRCEDGFGDISEIVNFIECSTLPEEVYQSFVEETIKILRKEENPKEVRAWFGDSAANHYYKRCQKVADNLIQYLEKEEQ